MKHLSFIILVLALLVSCNANIDYSYHVDHLNGYTPWEGKGDVDWVNAMLATIETEHIMRGDSVNLSPFYAIRKYKEGGYQKSPDAFDGSPMLLIDIIERHGIVPFDSYRRSENEPPPLHVFMLGAQYTPQEFARSVCAPGEYIELSAKEIPVDSLLAKAAGAVNANHGVCWQGDDDCMAIVGLAHDDRKGRYFVMKTSREEAASDDGLVFVPFGEFRKKTVSIVLPR